MIVPFEFLLNRPIAAEVYLMSQFMPFAAGAIKAEVLDYNLSSDSCKILVKF